MESLKIILVGSFLNLLLFSNCQTELNETTKPKGQTVNGKKQGEWKTYYVATGRICTIEHYFNDSLHGPSVTFNTNGNLYTKANYNMGQLVDSFIHYYPNGLPNYQTWYDSSGKEQGEFKLYYENGRLKQMGHHKDGNKVGLWKEFDENGKIIEEKRYGID